MYRISQKHQVDLTSIEDGLTLGEFKRLDYYFLFLLELIEAGSKLTLYRFPENGLPVPYGTIHNIDEFRDWATPIINRY
ncbi:MAG: hypothetical protein V4456_22190 [Bacteroidota bacterium]